MTANNHKPIRWEAPKAKFHKEALERCTASAEPDRRPKQVTVHGPCPYCFGEVNFVQVLQLVHSLPGAVVGQAAGPTTLAVTVRCDCLQRHPGRPTNEAGCGHTWVVTVEF